MGAAGFAPLCFAPRKMMLDVIVECEGVSLKLRLPPKALARPLLDAVVLPFLRAHAARTGGVADAANVADVELDGVRLAEPDLGRPASELLLSPEAAPAARSVRIGLRSAAVCARPNPGRGFNAAFINLASRADRRAEMEAMLRSAGVEASRLEARTGREASEAEVALAWDTRLNARYDGAMVASPSVPMTDSERGCAASHAALWRHAAALPLDGPPLLVLEDDLLLCDRFGELVGSLVSALEARHSSTQRLGLLYLSAAVARWRDDEPAVATGLSDPHGGPVVIREAEYVWQTSSYVIWPAAARLLVSKLPASAPADNFLSRWYVEGALRAYCCWPLPAMQRAAHEGDVLRSGFGGGPGGCRGPVA